MAYRERHGLEDLVDDNYEEDSDIDITRRRRHQSEPPRYSDSTKTKTRHRFRHKSSEGSDSKSDAAVQPRESRYIRHRSEPDHRSKGITSRKKSEREKDKAIIRKLEKEIRRLNVGRSRSPEDRQRPQSKPQRLKGSKSRI